MIFAPICSGYRRPRAESASGLRTASFGMKSQIPKISKCTSQSQNQSSKISAHSKSNLDPESLQQKTLQDLVNVVNASQENSITEKTCNITLTDNSVKSEDFKDALDDKHENGAANPDGLKDASQVRIARKDSISSRKSSTSGIPLPVKNSPSRMSSLNGSPRARSDSRGSDVRCTLSPTKRSLELQFLTKKKKLEQLKKDLEAKQKPVVELYQSLLLIKNQLEDSGKIVPLENMKFWDFEERENHRISTNERADVSAGGELVKLNGGDVDAAYMENLREEMEPIPRTFEELGKCLMGKRADLLYLVERVKTDVTDNEPVIKEIELINEETDTLQKTINEAVERQESRIERILKEVGGIFQKSSLAITHQVITDLENKLRHEEQVLEDLTKELNHTQQELKDVKEMKELTGNKLMEENNSLKERVRTLENDVQIKKKKLTELATGAKTNEHKVESLTRQVAELDKAKRDAETRACEMNSHMRTLQSKLKNIEQKWREEKEEIMKSHKGEHAILEKLTAERQTLDTRVHLMNNILDEQKKTNETEQARLRQETASAKAALLAAMMDKQILEDKVETLLQEVAKLSVQQQQAADVIKNTMNPDQTVQERGEMTEREAQLHTELLATQVALKAAQERIENYTAEKMRFIESIEKLNANGDNATESIGKALVKKEEIITRLKRETEEATKLAENQALLISHLNAKVDNLQAEMVVNNLDNIPRDTHELKLMLEEGKAKLQKALAKSLENEQKLIKYEHDLNQHKKQLNDMENLLKVRDGLIGMMKAKKDELVMENESLHRYSEEIRQLLFDTKEELKQKTEMIQDLTGTLDNKSRLCYRLEKRIKDLEHTLSETNEKRFKLQDSLGTMEKELQSTKAHIGQITEMQTRYEIGTPLINTDVNVNCSGKSRGTYKPPTSDTLQMKPHCNNTVSSPYTDRPQPEQLSKRKLAAPPTVRSIFNEQGDTEKVPKLKRNRNYVMKGRNSLHEQQPQESVSRETKNEQAQMEGDANKMPERYSSYKYSMAPALGETQPNTYYVSTKAYRFQNNLVRKISPFLEFYRQSPFYRPTQSLVAFAPLNKIHSIKNNSALGLTPFQKNAVIQTFPQKTNSSTQTDPEIKSDAKNLPDAGFKCAAKNNCEKQEQVNLIIREPYKMCCNILANEHCMAEEVQPNLSESQKKERKEFIDVIKKLSEFDSQRREQLGLGREFIPILFGGIHSYKVMESGNLMWCKPSREMRLNNVLISKDIMAHCCQHFKHDRNKKIKFVEAVS